MATSGVFSRVQDRDKSITPFKVYKSWAYNTTSSFVDGNVDRFVAKQPNPINYSGNVITLSSLQLLSDSASLLTNSASNLPASIYWYSLNHLYYRNVNDPFNTFGNSASHLIDRSLYPHASIISVPQQYFGEQIQPESVIFKVRNTALNITSMSLYDDGNGNLIDADLSSSISNEVLYLQFNSMRYAKNWAPNYNASLSDRVTIDKIQTVSKIQELNCTSKNVWITNNSGYPVGSTEWGESAVFHGNGYIRIQNTDQLNFTQDQDYAVSFWATIPSAISTSNEYLLTKRSIAFGQIYNVNRPGNLIRQPLTSIGDRVINASQYPFEIFLSGSTPTPTLVAQYKTGGRITKLPYVTTLSNINNMNHILFQKTGSMIELFVNGTKEASGSVPEGNIQTQADIFIGSLGLNTITKNGINGFNGVLKEFFFFNKSLTNSEVMQLAHTGSNFMVTNRNRVGNVFYEHGIITITDPRPKYGTESDELFDDVVYNLRTLQPENSSIDQIYFEFNSSLTIYEHEYICKIREGDFNFTMNPTIRKNNDPGSEFPKSFVALDEFAPYITTVGLYNDKGQLLAIGKLGTPIRKRDDVDLNIIVRFDA